jgi:hypothetical protein
LLLEDGEPSSTLNLSARHRAGAALSVIAAAALALRRPRLALAALAATVALNGRLHALIWRRRGPLEAAASVPLHLLHQLTAVAAAAGGLAAHLLRRRPGGYQGSPRSVGSSDPDHEAR